MGRRSVFYSLQSDSESADSSDAAYSLMPIRDVAAKLGIGRTRVVQLEKSAVRKLRGVFQRLGVQSIEGLECVSDKHIDNVIAGIMAGSQSKALEPYRLTSGWLTAGSIRSMNGGSEDPQDIAQAFQYFKKNHESIVHPPVLISADAGVCSPFHVGAAAFYEESLRLRLWPLTSGRFSVAAIQAMHLTVIVDSVFASDSDGVFDVPILMCAIISTRPKPSTIRYPVSLHMGK